MPAYKIETTYHLPVCRQRTYEADTLEEACRAAIADEGWDDGEEDVDTSGETYVSGIWDGANVSYAGASIPVPSQFDEVTQRRARHFEILLGLSKILLRGAHAGQPPSLDWLARSAWAIARGEAILARAPDPQEPLDLPKPSHVLARLQEHRVRDAIAAVLEVDRSFEPLSSAAVTDDDVHSACLTIASTIDLSTPSVMPSFSPRWLQFGQRTSAPIEGDCPLTVRAIQHDNPTSFTMAADAAGFCLSGDYSMNILSPENRQPSSGYKVDITRGERIGRVSSEWFSRPDDERYLSLSDLHRAVSARTEHTRVRTVESADIRVEATRDNAERLSLIVPGSRVPLAPTHWSYGQLCSLVGAPANYMRQLPAPLAAINLQHGLLNHSAELVKTLEMDDGRVELRAVTGPEYGRIWDKDLVAAVMSIAGNGTGDTIWKVPGVLDWSTMTHNPFVDITKDTTTLYASDRDVFLFLVDDTQLIEAGRLPNGEPDLYFRGFYAWNSEVGSRTLGIASFYLRAVCANRNLWGTEDFQEITIRHSKFAAQRFAHEAAPALTSFANSSPAPFVAGIRAARERVVARNEEDRSDFLRKRGFSKAETGKIIEAVLSEEGRPPESVFDFVQGITALARGKAHQDTRLELEGKARKLLESAV